MAKTVKNPKLKRYQYPDWLPTSKKVSEEHKNLYHYTSLKNFIDIYKSQELWAFDYKSMNDAQENIAIDTFLIKEIEKNLIKQFIHMSRESFKTRRLIEHHHGTLKSAASENTKGFIKALKDTVYGNEKENGFAKPFLFSFCTHDDDTIYTKENGLLSQWRSYGRDNGVAIVFDSKRIENLLSREGGTFAYHLVGIGSTVYADNITNIDQEFSILFKNIASKFAELFEGKKPDFGELFGPYIMAATRIKHQAFVEEREVRIYALPMDDEAINMRKEDPEIDERPKKQIENLLDRDYIRLFSDNNRRLPIKRIIIGPSDKQDEIFKTIRELVSGEITIKKSATPLVNKMS